MVPRYCYLESSGVIQILSYLLIIVSHLLQSYLEINKFEPFKYIQYISHNYSSMVIFPVSRVKKHSDMLSYILSDLQSLQIPQSQIQIILNLCISGHNNQSYRYSILLISFLPSAVGLHY